MYALGGIFFVSFADLFRKLGSQLKDPFVANLLFQTGAFTTAIILYFLFSRKAPLHTNALYYALTGGVFISIFTAFSFKALEGIQGVSTVMPFMRIGGVILLTILGILLLKEKFTWNLFFGIILASTGMYLLFTNK